MLEVIDTVIQWQNDTVIIALEIKKKQQQNRERVVCC